MTSSVSAFEVVEEIERGMIAIPPWQRDDVWTIEQRYRMIDSMTRGLPVGPIIIWQPRFDRLDLADARSMLGHPINERAGLVIDGRQRITTLAMAARGDFKLRWDGSRWQDGPGVIELDSCFRCLSASFDVSMAMHDAGVDRAVISEFCRVYESLFYYKVNFLVLQTTNLADVVETYRRLATCGSPHSLEDLAIMETWLARQASWNAQATSE